MTTETTRLSSTSLPHYAQGFIRTVLALSRASTLTRTFIYACTDDRPGCSGLASSSDGSLTLTRADDVVSGTFTVSLRGYDRSDYGEATVVFTVPPVQVVP